MRAGSGGPEQTLQQLSLLQGPDRKHSCSGLRGAILWNEGEEQRGTACRWSHPYYWAPFVLVGNWLSSTGFRDA